MGISFVVGLGIKPTPNPNTIPLTALRDEENDPLQDETGEILEADE